MRRADGDVGWTWAGGFCGAGRCSDGRGGEIEAETLASVRSSLSKLMTVNNRQAEVEAGSVAGGSVCCVKPMALMDALCKPPAANGEKSSCYKWGSDCGHAVMHIAIQQGKG